MLESYNELIAERTSIQFNVGIEETRKLEEPSIPFVLQRIPLVTATLSCWKNGKKIDGASGASGDLG
jgi:hypothetical protein